jgi:colanic acid biosynthesis protein WcaH
MAKLSIEDFLQVVSNTPLIALDLVIQDTEERVLLGWRVNEPAKESWFVPGGRIYKNERLKEALTRILETELGIKEYHGTYKVFDIADHIYDTCFYPKDPHYTNTHYVVIGIQIVLEDINLVKLEGMMDQHSRMKWMSVSELLQAQDVHEYTKKHFLEKGFEGTL